MAWFVAPGEDNARTAEHLGIKLRPLIGRSVPTLAILGVKARDIMGYTFTMFLADFPAALIAVTLLAPHVAG